MPGFEIAGIRSWGIASVGLLRSQVVTEACKRPACDEVDTRMCLSESETELELAEDNFGADRDSASLARLACSAFTRTTSVGSQGTGRAAAGPSE